jgi:hypothetical protein
LDTVIREATIILENRIRNLSNAPNSKFGVDLASFAFGGQNPQIRISELTAEQEAAHLLYRGIFGFIRNSSHHNLIINFDSNRVLQIIAFIDYLIYLAENAKHPE